ncbi:hypothetical protein [Thermostaphylospora chromogena]|uniref:hypothetical protein n=1 Tax=Thermostaphylospora chromogena TaxID=35622 RepID=UPI000B82FC14|nr:hypothetical protein [Thermostaphylospora chromogena]
MAVLAGGFGTMGVNPAAASTECKQDGPVAVLHGPNRLASLCNEHLDLRAEASSAKMTPRRDSEMLATLDRIARRAGLDGLSQATAVLSFADMGGAAAGAGAPSLPMPKPTPAHMAASQAAMRQDGGLPGAAAVSIDGREVTPLPALSDLAEGAAAVDMAKDADLLPVAPRRPDGEAAKPVPLDAIDELGVLDDVVPDTLN